MQQRWDSHTAAAFAEAEPKKKKKKNKGSGNESDVIDFEKLWQKQYCVPAGQEGKWQGKKEQIAPDGSVTARCKQCKQWGNPEGGIYSQRRFFCKKCWTTFELKHHTGDAGLSNATTCATEDYRAHWAPLVKKEWEEEVRIVEDRIAKWPVERLVSRGFCLTNMSGRRNGRYFSKTKMAFTSSNLVQQDTTGYSRGGFVEGDEVTISRTHPLEDDVVHKAEVLQAGPGWMNVAAEIPPPDLQRGVWRIDAGANKTAHDRVTVAINCLTSARHVDRMPDAVVSVLVGNFDVTSSAVAQPDAAPEGEPCNVDFAPSPQTPEATRFNFSQESAIASVVPTGNADTGFLHLIQGPPGTGKTTTTAELINRYVNSGPTRRKVLVAADSNVAVDQLLASCVKCGTLKVLRMGACATKIAEEMHEHTLIHQMDNHPKAAEMENHRLQLIELKEELYGDCPPVKKGKMRSQVAHHQARLKELQQELTTELLGNADVICSTLIGCGGDALLLQKFPLVIIDEASMATEPRCLVAVQKLANADDAKLVLVGDQQQLPPVVFSEEAARGGLNVSLFDRIISQGRTDVNSFNLLQVQYRMHPLLRSWPSHAFYGNRLLDGIATDSPSSNNAMFDFATTPIVFIDTSGHMVSEGTPDTARKVGTKVVASTDITPSSNFTSERNYYDTGSKCNTHEIDVVEGVVAEMASMGEGWENIQLGVISPYTAQVTELRTRLLHRQTGLPATQLEVKTVDGFQGREKDVIIFSCVRTASIGFLNDYRRLNVAITRAKRGLVIIGDSRLLRSDPTWASFLTFIRNLHIR